MIRYFLFVISSIYSIAGVGQDQNVVDSLYSALDDRVGGERFLPLYHLAFEYMYKDNECALSIMDEARDAALLSGDSLWIVKSMRVKGHLLNMLERNHEAIKILEFVLPICVRNGFADEQVGVEDGLGKAHLYLGNYDEALKMFFDNVHHAKELNEPMQLSYALHHLGIVYYKLKDYHKALDYFSQSLDLAEVTRYNSFMLTNMGLCYAHLDDFVKAKEYVQQGLNYCEPNCGLAALINIEYAFGLIAYKQKRLALAEKHFLKSHGLARSAKNKRFLLDNMYLLMELYLEQRRLEEARILLLDAEKVISEHPPFNLELIKIYSRFYDYYLRIGNFERASFYQSRYISLKDSVYDADLTANLMRLEAGYLERENAAKLTAQDAVILSNEILIHRQRSLIVITVMLALSILGLFISLSYNYKRRKQVNYHLEKKVKDRTLELEWVRDGLLIGMREKELQLTRVFEAITKKAGTIEGLCLTGAREVSDDVARSYFLQIRQSIRQLSLNYQIVLEEKSSNDYHNPAI